MIRTLNNGQPQQNPERMRQEFPFLAQATEGYALGEVWSRPGLDNRTRQLAAVTVMAALGERALMKVHAGYALNVGATDEELKEMIYLVTVTAGFPKAIAASQTLSEFFEERRNGAAIALQLQIRQAEAKRVIFEHRSGAYIDVREHRSEENCPLQPGITKNATVVIGASE